MSKRNKIFNWCVGNGLLLLISSNLYSQTLYVKGDTLSVFSGGVLYVPGGIENATNGVKNPFMKNEGTINLTGDLTHNTGTIYQGKGKVELSGSSLQTFKGAYYGKLKVSGSGEKRLIGACRVRDSLMLTGTGYVNTSLTKDTVFCDSTCMISEQAGYEVIGNLKYTKYLKKDTAYTFGNMGLNFQALGATPGRTNIIRSTGDSAIQKPLLKSGYTPQSTKRFFDIHPANNAALNATISFHYDDAELNGYSESSLALFRSIDTGRHWTYVGYLTRDASANTLTINGVNSFSRWTTGSQSNPLPVELLDFTAKWKTVNVAQLDWHTVSETNNALFEVERSWDGRDFYKIGEKPGHGTTSIPQAYTLDDHLPTSAINSNIVYYRLKQIDYNGQAFYSEIRKLALTNITPEIKVWYNNLKESMVLEYSCSGDELLPVKVIDAQAKEIVNESLKAHSGTNQFELSIAGLAKGIYTVYIMQNGETVVRRIMRY